MSRIHEALSRASRQTAAERSGTPATAVYEQAPPDAGVLTQYPPEEHPVVNRSALPVDRAVPDRLRSVGRVERPASRTHEPLHVPSGPGGPTRVSTPPRTAGPLLEEGLHGNRALVSTASDPYLRLSAALQEMQDRSRWPGREDFQRGLKSVLVTSSLPREGKTQTVVNLARALSEAHGRRVLLVDAHLRRPSVHDVLGVSNEVGLSDVLRSEAGDVPLQQVSPLLSVLPAGCSARDQAVVAPDRMRTLLDYVLPRFDWVLIDAPAVGSCPDPHVLARLTKAVLFVIESRSTPYRVVDRAIAGLGHACIIGTVLNRVQTR